MRPVFNLLYIFYPTGGIKIDGRASFMRPGSPVNARVGEPTNGFHLVRKMQLKRVEINVKFYKTRFNSANGKQESGYLLPPYGFLESLQGTLLWVSNFRSEEIDISDFGVWLSVDTVRIPDSSIVKYKETWFFSVGGITFSHSRS